MKNIIAFESKATKRTYGGYNITLKVYRIKSGELQYLGDTKYCTASTRGDKSEVYNFLIEEKEIPKKAYGFSETISKGGNTGSGYYLNSNPWCKISVVTSD